MAADTISGSIRGLLDGVEFKQTAYALDRDSRKAALARFLCKAAGEPSGRGRGTGAPRGPLMPVCILAAQKEVRAFPGTTESPAREIFECR